MAGYTKLSSTLVTSTVWREDSATRCVWITMLALADQHGEVQASIPGLADVSRVTIEECEKALDVFLSPDIYSRTKTYEGRRLLPIDGGWAIVNYSKYRDLLSMEHRRSLGRERARRFRDKEEVTESNAPVTQSNDKQKQTQKHTQLTTTTLASPVEKKARTTWLTPYAVAWKDTYGGDPVAGQLVKALAPVRKEHGDEEALRRWGNYLRGTEAPYANPFKFASTWGQWDTGKSDPRQADYEQAARDADAGGYVV